ncbi:MAG: alpha-glucosidase [Nannocystaceae bacterium]
MRPWKPIEVFTRLCLVVGALALVVALVATARWGARAAREWPIDGALTVAEGAAARRLTSGAFTIRWIPEAGAARLEVVHASDPAKLVWASVPGAPFVAAAAGRAAVEESRGSFRFADARLRTCADQRVARVVVEEPEPSDGDDGDDDDGGGGAPALIVAGTLDCDAGERVGYVLRFAASDVDGHLGFALTIENGDENADERVINRAFLTYASAADERFYGFGEQFSRVDMKGARLPIFIQEQGIGRGREPLTTAVDLVAKAGGDWHTTYAAAPQYITSRLRALLLENSERAVFDLRRVDRAQLEVWSPTIRGRILAGETPAALIRATTAYTGRMRPLPAWIGDGAVVGVQGGTARVRELWQALRARGTPIAAFWIQDWVGQRRTSFGEQLWWSWTLDEARYPGWDALVADLEGEGIAVMTYVNPFLVDVGAGAGAGAGRRNLFAEASAAGYLVKGADGAPYMIPNTDFSAGLLDLTSPAAAEWFRGVLAEEVIARGVRGWMADFGEALPYDAALASGEPAASFHNRYPVEWAALNRAAVDAASDGDQLVFFTRAGFTRSPGASTLFWEGDQLVTWDAHDGLKSAVVGLVSGGFSGITLNHSDIGGYTALRRGPWRILRERELLMRWMELSAFTAVYRTHEGNLPEDNAQIDDDAALLAHFDRFAKVYRAWAPYRRELIAEAATSGMPLVRHPFLHFPDDPRVAALAGGEFMIGGELLFAPVTDPGVDAVRVYLPAAQWIHLWSGRRYDARGGGRSVTVAAPLGEPALFYRAGSIYADDFRRRLAEVGIDTPPAQRPAADAG